MWIWSHSGNWSRGALKEPDSLRWITSLPHMVTHILHIHTHTSVPTPPHTPTLNILLPTHSNISFGGGEWCRPASASSPKALRCPVTSHYCPWVSLCVPVLNQYVCKGFTVPDGLQEMTIYLADKIETVGWFYSSPKRNIAWSIWCLHAEMNTLPEQAVPSFIHLKEHICVDLNGRNKVWNGQGMKAVSLESWKKWQNWCFITQW